MKTKKVKEEKEVEEKIIESTFLNSKGKEVKVSDIICKEDCWFLKRASKWVLAHNGVQKLAKVAGISEQYSVSDPIVQPSYENELEYLFRVTIHCKSGVNSKCMHGEPDTSMLGEANRVSAPNRGRGYLAIMAEKRGYDRAVLKHLGLVNVYSEVEADEFEKEDNEQENLHRDEFEGIADDVNKIINSKGTDDLKKILPVIKKRIGTYNSKQQEYLRKLFAKQVAKYAKTF
jgi:hypothetical protein